MSLLKKLKVVKSVRDYNYNSWKLYKMYISGEIKLLSGEVKDSWDFEKDIVKYLEKESVWITSDRFTHCHIFIDRDKIVVRLYVDDNSFRGRTGRFTADFEFTAKQLEMFANTINRAFDSFAANIYNEELETAAQKRINEIKEQLLV